MHMTAQKTFGVAALRQGLQVGHQVTVKGSAGHRIINGFAIHLGGARAVEVGFGTAFDLQRMHAHVGQAFHMLHRAQVLGVHDVGAVLVLERGHLFIGALGFLEQKHLIGRRADSQRRLKFLDDIAGGVLHRRHGLVFPTAGIGAGALVGVAFVHVPGQQAAPGIGHA